MYKYIPVDSILQNDFTAVTLNVGKPRSTGEKTIEKNL